MARPNRIATRMIGRKLITGPVALAPTRLWAQPHWKPATTAPRDAPMDSRKPAAALIGTTIDRNAMSSSRRESPTTRAAKGGSEEVSRSDTSMATEVGAVTDTSAASVWAIAGACARMVVTRCVVALSWGPLRGMTDTTAVRPSVPNWAGVIVATSGKVLTVVTTAVAASVGV